MHLDNRRVMATTGTPPMGRDRRRTDLYGRVRRFLYGLLLLAAAPGAVAVEELAHFGRYRVGQAVATPEARPLATVQGLVVLRADPADDGDGPPRLALDTVTAQLDQADAERAPQFRITAIESGGAFDLPVSDFGDFRLNLLLHRDEMAAWALGGTLELERPVDGGRHVAAVPPVRVQGLHRSETRYLPFEIALLRSQLTFKWRTVKT